MGVAAVSAQLSLLIYALVAIYYVLPNLPRSSRDVYAPAGGTPPAP
jgi:hypothetical protein